MSLISNPPPLFLLGCPRSGTTVTAGMLNGTCWGAPVETQFITRYLKRPRRIAGMRGGLVTRALAHAILAERAVQQWRLDVSAGQLAREAGDGDYARLIDTLMMHRSRGLGLPSWADKTPHYILDVELIAPLFPESKIINVIRDGRDVALSLLGRTWGPSNIYTCARYWADCTEDRPIFDRLRHEGRYLEVRYEDLLAEPEATVERVFAFLEQDPDNPEVKTWLSRLRRDNSTGWPRKMAAEDVALFEAAAGERLVERGYELTTTPRRVGRREHLRYVGEDRLRQTTELIRQNTIEALQIKLGKKEPFAE